MMWSDRPAFADVAGWKNTSQGLVTSAQLRMIMWWLASALTRSESTFTVEILVAQRTTALSGSNL
jgi:hypothetical protein